MRVVSVCIILFIILGGEWKATQCGYGIWNIMMIDNIQLEWYNGNVYFQDKTRFSVVWEGATKLAFSTPAGRKTMRIKRIQEYAYDDERVYVLFQNGTEDLYLGDIEKVRMPENEIHSFPLNASPISEAKSVYESLDWIELRSDICENIRLSRLLLIGAFLFLFGKLLLIGFRKLQIQ